MLQAWSFIDAFEYYYFFSTFCTSCYEGLSMYIQQMFCIVIWSPAICSWIQIVTLRLEILGLQGQHLKLILWPSMLLLVGTERQNCFLIVLSTLLQLIYGQWAAFLVKSWPDNPYFLAKIMFISWDL